MKQDHEQSRAARFPLTVSQTFGAAAILCAAALGMCVRYARDHGYVINTTPSLPRGLWQTTPIHGPVQRGEIVLLCPLKTEAFILAYRRGYLGGGDCPSGFERMQKPIVALPGDKVQVSVQGISVNGQWLKNSVSLATDMRNRPLPVVPPGAYTVAPNTVWVVSTFNRLSYDSRYFGPVPLSDIKGSARPIFVEGDQW